MNTCYRCKGYDGATLAFGDLCLRCEWELEQVRYIKPQRVEEEEEEEREEGSEECSEMEQE